MFEFAPSLLVLISYPKYPKGRGIPCKQALQMVTVVGKELMTGFHMIWT